MDKNELVIKIDLKPIYKDIEKYIKRKIQEDIRQNLDTSYIFDAEAMQIRFPDIERRLEKLEDWQKDLKEGFEQIPKEAIK
jgi:hypothetical protein